MKAFCIVVAGSAQSEQGFAALQESSERVGNSFPIQRFTATTPYDVDEHMGFFGLIWNYPWKGEERRDVDGVPLKLHAYRTKNPKARIACFMSHFRLWQKARIEPILILEDDALFIRRLDPDPLLDSPYHGIGINDPAGATRLPDVFHRRVQAEPDEIQPVPWIDQPEVPQGLAGASAYLMTPAGAMRAVALAEAHGAWPNDALLCRQLAPWLGVTKTYYTTIQGTPTTL